MPNLLANFINYSNIQSIILSIKFLNSSATLINCKLIVIFLRKYLIEEVCDLDILFDKYKVIVVNLYNEVCVIIFFDINIQ